MRTVVACLLVLLFPIILSAQDTPDTPMPTTAPPEAAELVKAQFGPNCDLALERSAVHVKYLSQKKEVWVNFLSGDFDGDGVPDAALVARCASPLAGEVGFDYKVEDPYFAANGYGNPKITAAFQTGDPEHQNVVLVILGAGAEGWHAAKPKAKYLLINLPFDNLQLMQVAAKKKKDKPVAALSLLEGEGAQNSVAFFDGKKWRWRDLGSQ